MKLWQNVCLNEILDKFENGLCPIKNNVTRSNLKKNPSVRSREHTFLPKLIKHSQNVSLNAILDECESGSFWVKN